MLPNFVGTSVSINPGETEEVTQNFTVQSSWLRDNCYLTVFLQTTDSPREIAQAEEEDLQNHSICEEESEQVQLFELGPNPVSNFLMIHIRCNHAEIEITDCSGRIRKVVVANQQTTRIPITDFNSGIYFCRDKTIDAVETRKFVKF